MERYVLISLLHNFNRPGGLEWHYRFLEFDSNVYKNEG